MRALLTAAATAVLASAATPPADAASGRDAYDMTPLLEEEHPFPGTYATSSRDTAARPNLPGREVGPDGTPYWDDGGEGEPSAREPALPDDAGNGGDSAESADN